MFSLSLNFPKFAAAGAIIALIVSGSPARADEMAQNLGPVGITAEAVAVLARGIKAMSVTSDSSSTASDAQEREADDINCVRQMPRYRPAPDFIFKC